MNGARAGARRLSGLLALVLAGCLVAALGGCGGGAAGVSDHIAGSGHTTRKERHPSTPMSGLPREEERLRGGLAHQLRLAGPASGAVVFDLTAGSMLFDLRGAVARPPASVEKLYTSVALLRAFGADSRIRTRVLGSGSIDRRGILHGNLYLKGGGDPTFGDDAFLRLWEHGLGSSSAVLARRVAAAGVRSVTGRLIGDASMYDTARGGPSSQLTADIPDLGGQLSALTYDHGATSGLLSPGAFAARQMAMTLRSLGIRVKAAPGVARAPRRAHELADISSPPLWQLLWLMNVPSDDLFAEMLTKQLGARYTGKGTIAAGARQISKQVGALGPHPRIIDGSGLSRRDSSSPAQVLALLRAVWHTPAGRVLIDSLPVVGQTGTVRRIGVGTAAQGHCIGKTGTLDYVTNLAGLCRSRDGHTIAFALFVDGPGNPRALALISRMVGAIAALR